MRPARIAELLQPFLSLTPDSCHSEPAVLAGEACPERSRRESAVLSAEQLQHISTYIDILLRWNARINLTAIRNEEEIVTRHFGESLFTARHLFAKIHARSSVAKDFDVGHPADDRRPTTEVRLADLGSGAGFPGIPIKLWAPQISITLIESNQKKATFLREVIRSLTLTNINIENARAETLPPSSFNVLTLRAVERLNAVLPATATLLVPGGRLALLISSAQIEACVSALPNFAWEHSIPVPYSSSRQLLLGRRNQSHH